MLSSGLSMTAHLARPDCGVRPCSSELERITKFEHYRAPTMLRSKGTDVAKTNVEKIGLLRGHHLFCDLDGSAFDQFGRSAKRKIFDRGASIFAKGDPGNSLFFVISGTVKIGVSSADGRGAIFNLINPGEIFGEIAVLDGLARTADAIANSDCELFVMDRRDFMILLDSQPLLAKKMIKNASELNIPSARDSFG